MAYAGCLIGKRLHDKLERYIIFSSLAQLSAWLWGEDGTGNTSTVLQ